MSETKTILLEAETRGLPSKAKARDFLLKETSFGALPPSRLRRRFAAELGPALRAGRKPAAGGRW